MVQTPSKILTLEEFLKLPETKPASEYIDGQIIQKSMPQVEHSTIQGELIITINGVTKPQKIARAFPELRCIFAGRAIVPDVAVFVWERIPRNENGGIANIFPLAPDWIDEPYVKKSEIVFPGLSTPNKYLQANIEYTERGFGDTNVYRCIKNCHNPQQLATVTQFLFWSLEQEYDKTQDMILNLVEAIKQVSLLTPSVSFQIYNKGKEVIIYPHGDPFLDTGIIDCVLAGLEDYPNVAKFFEKALKIYESGETSQYRNLLDNLRFAIEQLLKNILNNDAPLEKQKHEIESLFKKKGLHRQVLNLYKELLFNQYSRYQNDAVKHNEAFSLDEVEFMIYLTGNFMRLILQLARQEKNAMD